MPRYPDAETMKAGAGYRDHTQADTNQRIDAQRRLAAYRSVIFWTFPEMRRKERKPLLSCVYSMIRAMYPGHENEELWAELQHTVYVELPDDD